jgi:hypothetical protein
MALYHVSSAQPGHRPPDLHDNVTAVCQPDARDGGQGARLKQDLGYGRAEPAHAPLA